MAPKVRFRLKGRAKLQRRFRALGKRADRELEAQLSRSADEILARATALVPEKTRALLISGSIARRKLERAIFYDTEYALIMHEDTYQLGPLSALKAQTQDGPVGRKYLERPFNNMVRRLTTKDFPRAIRKAFRR